MAKSTPQLFTGDLCRFSKSFMYGSIIDMKDSFILVIDVDEVRGVCKCLVDDATTVEEFYPYQLELVQRIEKNGAVTPCW